MLKIYFEARFSSLKIFSTYSFWFETKASKLMLKLVC